jgi:excisionase family DNA binding protein
MSVLLKSAEVARRLGVSVEYVRDLVRDGRLQAYRLTPGGPLHFTAEDVDQALRPVNPPAQLATATAH